MLTIHTIGSAKIQMYFLDHNPPHFHVSTPNAECSFRIADCSLLFGRYTRDMDDAVEWAAGNQAMLMGLWDEYHQD